MEFLEKNRETWRNNLVRLGRKLLHFCLGIVGFGLFLIYDINSVRWKNRLLHSAFFVGCFILTASTAWKVYVTTGRGGLSPGAWTALIMAGISFILLIYTLFFALPFDETYLEQAEEGKVYDGGMYALCRHPGVLWFFLFYLFLGLALGRDVLLLGMWYSVLNLLYIIFQDIWTFPKTFADYGTYRKRTPFLLPSGGSVRRAWATRKSKR